MNDNIDLDDLEVLFQGYLHAAKESIRENGLTCLGDEAAHICESYGVNPLRSEHEKFIRHFFSIVRGLNFVNDNTPAFWNHVAEQQQTYGAGDACERLDHIARLAEEIELCNPN